MYKAIITFVCLSFALVSCNEQGGKNTCDDSFYRDLPQLKESGEITAVTLYSSTSYFQYRMQPMGYEYDLAEDFAESLGLKLVIKIAQTDSQLVAMLRSGEADFIAYPMFINNESKQHLLFCGHEQQTSQVIVQRGIKIQTLDKDSLSTEDLIEKVSKGEIPYTVSDDNLARLNRTYYWNIDTRLKISFKQRSSWAVRMNSPLLAQAINTWSTDTRRNPSFKAITKRYFELSKTNEGFEIPEIKDGHLSPYDDLFRKHARLLDWDWRLLASISYQESKFNPHVVSWAGAEGLMGIIPSTARRLGVAPHELKDPDTSIRTGVDCLRRFRQGFSRIEDPEEKIKFTLAAYNAGIGHVYDAQRLAEKYGKDPLRWDDNVAEFIRLKNDPEYYNDPVCKHGYLRGSETFNYVNEILARYKYYKKKRP